MKQPKIIGFQFQEIPLHEAISLSLAGSGNYSDIKAMVIKTLPLLSPDKAFAFGIPGKNGSGNIQISEDQRRGICAAVNHTLKKAHLSWKITYSNNKNLFVCVPSQIAQKQVVIKERSPYKKHTYQDLGKGRELIQLATKVFNFSDWESKARNGVPFRVAVCVVAVNDLQIRTAEIAPLLGLTYSGVYFNAKAKKIIPKNEKYIQQLRNALKEKK